MNICGRRKGPLDDLGFHQLKLAEDFIDAAIASDDRPNDADQAAAYEPR